MILAITIWSDELRVLSIDLLSIFSLHMRAFRIIV